MVSHALKAAPSPAARGAPCRAGGAGRDAKATPAATPGVAPTSAFSAIELGYGRSFLGARLLPASSRSAMAPSRSRTSTFAILANDASSPSKVSESIIPLGDDKGKLIVEVYATEDGPLVSMEMTTPGDFHLHWGIVYDTITNTWIVPPEGKLRVWPAGSRNHKHRALKTDFPSNGRLAFLVDPEAKVIEFALVSNATGNWIKRTSGNNFSIRLPISNTGSSPSAWDSMQRTVDTAPPPPTVNPGGGWRSELAVDPEWRDELKPQGQEGWRSELTIDEEDEAPPAAAYQWREELLVDGEAPAAADSAAEPPSFANDWGRAAGSATPADSHNRTVDSAPPRPRGTLDTPPPLPVAAAAAPPPPPGAAVADLEAAAAALSGSGGASPFFSKLVNVAGHGQVLLQTFPTRKGGARAVIVSDVAGELLAHWAVTEVEGGSWKAPPGPWATDPPLSSDGGGGSWDTVMEDVPVGSTVLRAAAIDFSAQALASDPMCQGLTCVLRAGSGQYAWLKDGKRDFWLPMPVPAPPPPSAPKAEKRKEKKSKRGSDKRGPSGPVDPPTSDEASLAKAAFEKASREGKDAPLRRITRTRAGADGLECSAGSLGGAGWGGNVCDWMVDDIAKNEDQCRRSLMHRYNTATDLLNNAAGAGGDAEAAVGAIYTWMRYMSLRQLIINRNYNIKPRELSAAQDRLAKTVTTLQRERPELRDVTRLLMSAVGRGGQGDVGQRIRDEILSIQSRNGCKGGMMEEWHQKLHNNTCPDDVVICQALLDHIAAGLDMGAYWATLHASNIDAARLLSYDRAIHSEPSFSPGQCEGLTRDLKEYMRTLKAVHTGADLDSAAETVLGYHQASCKGKEINVPPIEGVASTELAELLTAATHPDVLDNPLAAAEAMVEARRYLRPWVANGGGAEIGDRLKEVVYLDLALEGQVRVVIERSLPAIREWGMADVVSLAGLALENYALAAGGNQELVSCFKDWGAAASTGALRIKSVVDRIRLALGGSTEHYTRVLQPTASSLGEKLGCDGHVVGLFSEEAVRGTAAAPLSQLLNVLEPLLRAAADMGKWQVISNTEAAGLVVYVEKLESVQFEVYPQPTIVVAGRVGGEEELPENCVGVVTADMPDVLSHISVRARNEGALFGTCFDPEALTAVRELEGQWVKLCPRDGGNDVGVEVLEGAVADPRRAAAGGGGGEAAGPTGIAAIERRDFKGYFAVSSRDFSEELVGGKSRNLNGLRGNVPEWVGLPASAALPYGVCERVLQDPINRNARRELEEALRGIEGGGDIPEGLARARAAVSSVKAPPEMVEAMEAVFRAEHMPFPYAGVEWAKAWAAITGVWASKWNERAFISCRKAGLKHDHLRMAVLCQEVVSPRYAFVAHTTNPTTGDANEVYVEMVQGLGEALVGNYPGKAFSFSARKNDLDNPTVLGYPSKSLGLFPTGDTMIFRSDSNGEDLEGYAGAGLYDSITMDECVKSTVDYGADPLLQDEAFQRATMAAVARACVEVEAALGGAPQDIEGVLTPDGKLYVVQTRPQVG